MTFPLTLLFESTNIRRTACCLQADSKRPGYWRLTKKGMSALLYPAATTQHLESDVTVGEDGDHDNVHSASLEELQENKHEHNDDEVDHKDEDISKSNQTQLSHSWSRRTKVEFQEVLRNILQTSASGRSTFPHLLDEAKKVRNPMSFFIRRMISNFSWCCSS